MDQDLLTKGSGATALRLCVPICVSLSRPSDISIFAAPGSLHHTDPKRKLILEIL